MAAKGESKPRKQSKDNSNLYQPSPRAGHFAVAVVDQVFLGLGSTEKLSERKKRDLPSHVEIHSPYSETWIQKDTTGSPPPGTVHTACASIDNRLYTYGGNSGGDTPLSGTLNQLDTTTREWMLLTANIGPLSKKGAGMIAFNGDKLALFGGLAVGVGLLNSLLAVQPESALNGSFNKSDKVGLTNEFHIFDINNIVWSAPPMTGDKPLPCSSFSFTSVNEQTAVLFGGFLASGPTSDIYILKLNTMHWTKIEKRIGEPWPVERAGHAACCIGYGGSNPQILITGGMDSTDKTLGDMWLFDVSSRKWKKLKLHDGGIQSMRVHHTATAITLGAGIVEVIIFGGIPDMTSSNGKSPHKISETIIMGFGFDVVNKEWSVLDVATNIQRANQRRLTGKMGTIATKAKEMVSLQEHVLTSQHRAESESLRGTIQALEERVRETETQLQATRTELEESSATVQALYQTVEDSEETRRTQKIEADHELAQVQAELAGVQERLEITTQLLREEISKAQHEGERDPDWKLQKEEIEFTDQELGRGGWGVVKVAKFRGINVAAKKLFEQIVPFYRPSFIREMNIAARLRHPNLLQFIGATLDNEPIILTELMSTSLRKVVEQGPITHAQIISISLDVARALNYLHLMRTEDGPIIHRDISSANVLLNPSSENEWKAKVSDYGSVNLLRKLNTIGPGSPVYAAPEARTVGEQSTKMDIFSFGILLIEMVTHTFPEIDDRERLINSIQYPHLVRLIRYCIKPEKDDRPSSAEVIRELLTSQNDDSESSEGDDIV